MNRILFLCVLAGLFVLAGGTIVWASGHFPSQVSPATASGVNSQADKPVYGWLVCRDLGLGRVPGLPTPRQRFILCHPAGWQVQVYCLDPDLEPPASGRTCIRISEDIYRCGRNLQRLKEYKRLVTPSPTDTPTLTPTVTSTLTQTPTLTPTETPTLTPTETPTITPTSTREVTATPRTRPGGGGSGLEWPLALIIGLFLLYVVGMALVLSRSFLGQSLRR